MTNQTAACHRRRRHPQAHALRGGDRRQRSAAGRSGVRRQRRRLCGPAGLDAEPRPVVAIGVESTGSFGATLTRFLTRCRRAGRRGEQAQPSARHMDGKSDRLDAEQIARSVLARPRRPPRSRSQVPIEVIRTLRVARASAMRARTQAFNNLFGIMIGCPLAAPRRARRAHQAHLRQPVPATRTGDRGPPRADRRARTTAARQREAHAAGSGPALEVPRRRNQGARPPDRGARDPRRTGARRTVRRRRRARRPVPRDRRRQHQPDPQRGRLRQALRRRAQASQQRPNKRPPPTQPRRRPGREQRALHRRHRPHPPPPTNPRLHRKAHRRRAQQTRDHPLPQALHRTRSLRRPTQATPPPRRPTTGTAAWSGDI